jgi:hypothetical protein
MIHLCLVYLPVDYFLDSCQEQFWARISIRQFNKLKINAQAFLRKLARFSAVADTLLALFGGGECEKHLIVDAWGSP